MLLLSFVASCSQFRAPRPKITEGPPGVIQGRVTDRTGEPLPGVIITIIDGMQYQRNAVTDANGAFRIEQLPAGAYRVMAELGEFTTITSEATLTADQGATLLFRLSFPNTKAVTVTTEAGYSGEQDSIEYETRASSAQATRSSALFEIVPREERVRQDCRRAPPLQRAPR